MEEQIKSATDVELISLIAGVSEEHARELFNKFGKSLINIGNAKSSEIEPIKGFGKSRVTALMAALELGKRREFEKSSKIVLKSADDLYHYFAPKIGILPVEQFRVAVTNHRLQIIYESVIAEGGYSSVALDIRKIMREIVTVPGGKGFFVAHNHPAGSVSPSEQDVDLTERIKEASKVLGLNFLDHIIVANRIDTSSQYRSQNTDSVALAAENETRYYSFREEGVIN